MDDLVGPWRGGETVDAVGTRVDRVIARCLDASVEGDSLLFAHGHVLRVLTARWLGQPPAAGAHYALGTATIGILGWAAEPGHRNVERGLPPHRRHLGRGRSRRRVARRYDQATGATLTGTLIPRNSTARVPSIGRPASASAAWVPRISPPPATAATRAARFTPTPE